MIAKLEKTQINAQQNNEQTQNPNNGSNNKQRINSNRTTTLDNSLSHEGLNSFYWYLNFALGCAVVKTQKS